MNFCHCTLITRFLTLIAVLLLVACGSGGGSDAKTAEPSDDVPEHTAPTSDSKNKVSRETTIYIDRGKSSHLVNVDINGEYDQVSCEIVENVGHGTIETQESSCSYRYIPTANQLGNDRLVVKITKRLNDKVQKETVALNLKLRLGIVNLNEIIAQDLVKVITFNTANGEYPSHSQYSNAATGLGDFNGDGIDDFVIRSSNGWNAQLDVTMIYGKPEFKNSYNLREKTADMIEELGGELNWAEDYFTRYSSVNYIGDVNNDGYNDLSIGDGVLLVVFGGENIATEALDKIVSEHRTDLGLFQPDFNVLEGTPTDYYVNGVGDIDGDYIDDMLVTQVYPTPFGLSQLYAVPGATGLSALPDTSSTSNLYTFQITENLNGRTFGSQTQKGHGDVNGDGINDFITSDYLYDDGEDSVGIAYLFFGSSQFSAVTDITSATPNISGGMVIQSNSHLGANLGECLGIVQDINGDGLDEIALGNNEGHSIGFGFVYVLFGAYGFPQIFDLEEVDHRYGADKSRGFSLRDADVCEIASVGDLNNDGFNEMVVTEKHEDHTHPTTLHIIYGAPAYPSTIELDDFSEYVTAINTGEIISVNGAGDVNNDGYDDLLVATNNSEGTVYLIMGGDYFIAPMK